MSEPRKKILHVEDDASLQRLVRVVLEQIGGYAVQTIADGSRALDAAREGAPHLVLLDVDLPGMNGIAILRAMRATAELRDVPVVFLTAAAEMDLGEERDSLGVSEVLIKPFRPRVLVQTIDRVLGSRGHGG
jgi:two-component system, OmpR family, response regulator